MTADFNGGDMEDELRKALLKILEPKPLPDDFSIHDQVGSNVDDAFEYGENRGFAYGRWKLAQELLKLLPPEEKKV